MSIPYHGILLSNNKNQTTDIYNNLNELLKNDAELKKKQKTNYIWFHLETIFKVINSSFFFNIYIFLSPKCSQFLLFTALLNTESLLQGKCSIRFLQTSGHNNFISWSVHTLVLKVSPFFFFKQFYWGIIDVKNNLCIFNVHNLMSLDTCIHSWNHQHTQSNGYIHHPKFYVALLKWHNYKNNRWVVPWG